MNPCQIVPELPMRVEVRPSKAKPEKVLYISHWGFAHRIFLQSSDLVNTSAWRHIVRLNEALHFNNMMCSAFNADLLRDIPCAVMTNSGITFLASLDTICMDLPSQPGPFKQARSSTMTSTVTTSALPSEIVRPGMPYASVSSPSSAPIKRESYKPLADNISLNNPTDPIIIPDDSGPTTILSLQTRLTQCRPLSLVMGTSS